MEDVKYEVIRTAVPLDLDAQEKKRERAERAQTKKTRRQTVPNFSRALTEMKVNKFGQKIAEFIKMTALVMLSLFLFILLIQYGVPALMLGLRNYIFTGGTLLFFLYLLAKKSAKSVMDITDVPEE